MIGFYELNTSKRNDSEIKVYKVSGFIVLTGVRTILVLYPSKNKIEIACFHLSFRIWHIYLKKTVINYFDSLTAVRIVTAVTIFLLTYLENW